MNKHLKKATMAMAAGALMLAAAGTASLAGEGVELDQRGDHASAKQINFKAGNVQQVKAGNAQLRELQQLAEKRVSYRHAYDTRRARVGNRAQASAPAAPAPQPIQALGTTARDGGWVCRVVENLGLEQFGVDIALRCP
jgi:hypothetical protein